MRILTSGTLTVEAYDAEVYKQERNVLRVYDPNATVASLYAGYVGADALVAKYTLDEDNELIIDVSDYIRVNAVAGNLFVRTDGGAAQYVKADYRVVGLISPESLIVPKNVAGARIQFPTTILAAISGASIMYEFCDKNYEKYRLGAHTFPSYDGVYNLTDNVARLWERADNVVRTHYMGWWYKYVGQEGNGYKWQNEVAQMPQYLYTQSRDPRDGDDAFSDAGLTRKLPLQINGEDWYVLLHSAPVKPLDCERRYAAVRWVSATGVVRVHTFEVRDLTQTADETVSLETADGTYSQLRNRRDSFNLCIDNLNAYDYWYYADIINSQSVKVSFDGDNWRNVAVTTKSATIPNANSGKLSNLEINVNWREYDEVNVQWCNA